MRCNFTYSDHANKFKQFARDLDVDVWEYMNGAIFIHAPSPEAQQQLEDFIQTNKLVLIPEKEESQ